MDQIKFKEIKMKRKRNIKNLTRKRQAENVTDILKGPKEKDFKTNHRRPHLIRLENSLPIVKA